MTTTVSASAPPKLGYRPSLDGLRAVSVMAVMLYHADVTLDAGRVPRRRGVLRRQRLPDHLAAARRARPHRGHLAAAASGSVGPAACCPALYLLLAVVSVASMLVYRDAAGRMGGDVLAALFYVSNWWQIFLERVVLRPGGAAAAAAAPVVAGDRGAVLPDLPTAVRAGPGHARAPQGRPLGVLRRPGAGVAAWMAVRSTRSSTDPSDVYYGTVTRAFGPAARRGPGASVWAPWRSRGRARPRRRHGPRRRRCGSAWPSSPGSSPGSTPSTRSSTGAASCCSTSCASSSSPSSCTRPRGFRTALGWAPAGVDRPAVVLASTCGTGRSSWSPGRSSTCRFTGWPVFVLRMRLTFGAAELSYRYVETAAAQGGGRSTGGGGIRTSTGEQHAALVRRGMIVGGTSLGLVLLIGWGLHQAASSPDREKLALEAASAAAGPGGHHHGGPARHHHDRRRRSPPPAPLPPPPRPAPRHPSPPRPPWSRRPPTPWPSATRSCWEPRAPSPTPCRG